jgi:hypothetical protein
MDQANKTFCARLLVIHIIFCPTDAQFGDMYWRGLFVSLTKIRDELEECQSKLALGPYLSSQRFVVLLL